MDVLPVRSKKQKRLVKAPLPNPPFLLAVVAPPRSGKSTLICNFLKNEHWGYKWDKVVIISPTASHDETYKDCLEGVRVFSEPSQMDDVLAMCMKEQEEEMAQMLVVVDDCVGHMGRSLERMASKYRHYGISLIVASQQFRMLPPTVRTCAGYWVLFKTWNEKEVGKMQDEFSGQFPTFLEMYRDATKSKYNFLYMIINDSELWFNFLKRV